MHERKGRKVKNHMEEITNKENNWHYVTTASVVEVPIKNLPAKKWRLQ